MKYSIPFILLLILTGTSCTRFYIVKEDQRLTRFTEPRENSWEYLDRRNVVLVHQGNN
ncbi:MAG: hypothetical protein RL737_257, partial [Bacteroidota bacterium]